ncbi:hypothetical protein EC973_007817 [Apophysomyces ossiformis]|uniref:Uncharacterized protein n=1 Tax=Apophysomyces ossiformis TaxID=679940 RepID=A0A8H7BRJ4_9FUNG|nr:hypothetical protein EC973_007817 [Apophysomyces ossiformis]
MAQSSLDEQVTVFRTEDPYEAKYQLSSSIINEGVDVKVYENKPALSPPPAAAVKKKDSGRGSLDTYHSRLSRSSDGFEPISLDLLPTIQIGISTFDVCFNESK